MESNDSPEIPDRGETSDIPGLPSGVPSVSPLLKKHIRLGHAGIVDHSVDLSIPDF